MKTWITKTIVVSACVLGIAGCASPVDRIAEKPHCHTDRGRNAYCTKDPAPSIAKDDEAKLFASVPEALTVYVVRYWGDGHHPLDISVDGGAAMETVPNSMIRLRLKEGTHQITFNVGGKTFDRTISVTFMAQTLNTLGFTNACNQPEAQVDAISLSSAYGLYLTLKAVIDDRV
eukprot:gene22603-28739_t